MSKQERVVCAAIRFIRVNEKTGNESNIDVLCIRYGDESVKKFREELERSLYHYTEKEIKGFKTNKNRFADPVEAMKIAVEADQVGGILWKKVEARMLNDCGFIDRSKVKGKAIDETIKSYLEFPLKPEDLY